MATWRLAGFDTRGQDLELSELQLWSTTQQLDAEAVVTCSHAPAAGSLADLSDGDLQTACRWRAGDVESPGFYIQWETDGAPTRIKVAAGGDADAHVHACHLQVLHDGRWLKQRPYEGLEPQGLHAWYTTAPLARYLAHTDTVNFSASSATCVIPDSARSGDLILVAILHRYAIAAIPDGWAVAGRALDGVTNGIYQHLTILQRVAVASDAGAQVTVNLTGSSLVNIGAVVVDTGGCDVEVQAAIRIDNKNEPSGPGYVQVSPSLDLLASDVGIYAISTVFYINPASASDVWTVLPPARGVLGVAPRVAGGSAPRLAASVIEGLTGSYSSSQHTPATITVDPQLYNHVALRIRPIGSRLVTVGRAVTVGCVEGYLAAVGQPVLPQGDMPTRAIQTSALDMECGGSGSIYGTVELYAQSGNIPLPRRVRLHRSRDGLLVRETWSDAQGNYRFDGITDRYKYDVIAWDHEGLQQSVVANDLTPEPMS